MDSEQYFKDKINWKLFNYILDACVAIEDSGKLIRLDVSIYVNSGYYSPIFTYIGNGNIVKTRQFYRDDVNDGYIDKYEASGLYYVLMVDGINYDEVIPKISKRLELYKRQNDFCVFKEKK